MERNLEIEMSPVEDPVYGPYWQSEGQHQELQGPGQQRSLPSPHRNVQLDDGFQPYGSRRPAVLSWRVFAGMCVGFILGVLITLGILFLIKETVKDGVQQGMSTDGDTTPPLPVQPDTAITQPMTTSTPEDATVAVTTGDITVNAATNRQLDTSTLPSVGATAKTTRDPLDDFL